MVLERVRSECHALHQNGISLSERVNLSDRRIKLGDAYRLLFTATVLGQGKPMFGSIRERLDLRLIGTRTFESGSVLLEYEPKR